MNGANTKTGECRYCSKKIKRKDNLRRHEAETCQKSRITCECGIKLRKSSLARHRTKCAAYREATTTSTSVNTHEIPTPESETTTIEQHATMNEETPQTEATELHALNELPLEFDQRSQNEMTTSITLQTNVRVTKKCDGTILFDHDPIEINGIPMVLVPASMLTTVQGK